MDTLEPDHDHDASDHASAEVGHDHHGHSHGDLQPASPQLRRRLGIAVGVLATITLVSLIRLFPFGFSVPSSDVLATNDNVNATVTKVESKACGIQTCFSVSAQLDDGPEAGQTKDLPDMSAGPATPELRLGDAIVLSRVSVKESGVVGYNYKDYQRARPMWLLAILFAVLVVGVARWRGAAAIAGLAITWGVLIAFTIPAILNNESPVAVALTSAAAIAFVVLYLSHGVNARTTIALIGTVAALVLTGILAIGFVALTHLTGLASEEVAFIRSFDATVDVTGLLLAGIIIGTLGVLTDLTVTQAAIVWEIHAANPNRSTIALFRSGMRTGRDHIASTVYTLVLAYAGASLPVLILFALGHAQFGDVVTSELIAEEVVRTLVGSIGLVVSVPLTTALAAFVVTHSADAESPTLPEIPSLVPEL